MRRVWLVILMTLTTTPAVIGAPMTLTAYAEEWPPYNFTDRGNPAGISVDLLNAACVQAQINCHIEIVPWARAVLLVEQTPNTVLFTTARTVKRESRFLWVGPIQPRRVWVFGRRGEQRPASFADLNNHLTGVVRNDASEADLLARGVRRAALDESVDSTTNLRKLVRGHVDFVADNEIALTWQLRQMGKSAEFVERLLLLAERSDYYYAVNRRSDPELVQRLQAAIDHLRRTRTVDAIVGHYLREEVGEAVGH